MKKVTHMTKKEALEKAGYTPSMGAPLKEGEPLTERVDFYVTKTMRGRMPEKKVAEWLREIIKAHLEKTYLPDYQ